MKILCSIFMTFIVFLICTPLKSQLTISKAILHVNLKSRYLFSDKSEDLDVSLIQQFTLESTDTTYFINLQIKNSEAERAGTSIGWSYGLGVGISSNYNIKKENGFINIYAESFKKIERCLSTSYYYIKGSVDKSKTKLTAMCGDEILTFWGEYEPNSTPKYFLRLADAVYPLADEDYKKVMILFSTAKRYFETQP